MVKRKKTSPTTEEHENGMTPGSREGIGVDGRRNPSKKPEGCDDEESGEQASEERSTKGDDGVEILNPSASGLSPGSASVLPASPPNRTGLGSTQHPQISPEPAPQCHDQHHFLRSSVRPPSKRIRKDSIGSTINGHGGAKSKGTVDDRKVSMGGISRGSDRSCKRVYSLFTSGGWTGAHCAAVVCSLPVGHCLYSVWSCGCSYPSCNTIL